MSRSDAPGENTEISFRSRRKISSVLMLAAALSIFTAVAGVAYWVMQPVTLRIVVGPPGGDDQTLVLAMAQAFSRDRSPVRLTPITTGGTLASITALGAGKTDLAVVRGDLEMPADAEAVAILRKNVVVLWAPSGSPPKGARAQPAAKIEAIDDLARHRVGIVGLGQANVILLRVILAESGVNPEKVQVTQFGTDQVAEMIRDPAIDAFMMVGPLDDKTTADAIASTARFRGVPKFLPVDVSEAIAERHPLYESDEIPGSAFSASPARPDDKVETVSVNQLIVAPRSLSEDTVGAFTRQLFNIKPALARELPLAAKIAKPDTDKDAALPAHPGAAAYIDGTERTFMDKYSDYIWGAVLLLSGLGSAAAWLRHFLKRDERKQNTLQRDKLLVTIARAREVESLEELAAMQRVVDGILRETLSCHDDGAISDGDLSAFSIVLVQFHQAIIDRRAAISLAVPDIPHLRAPISRTT
jgi:TRAP transporter TAXI family solute receptor